MHSTVAVAFLVVGFWKHRKSRHLHYNTERPIRPHLFPSRPPHLGPGTESGLAVCIVEIRSATLEIESMPPKATQNLEENDAENI